MMSGLWRFSYKWLGLYLTDSYPIRTSSTWNAPNGSSYHFYFINFTRELGTLACRNNTSKPFGKSTLISTSCPSMSQTVSSLLPSFDLTFERHSCQSPPGQVWNCDVGTDGTVFHVEWSDIDITIWEFKHWNKRTTAVPKVPKSIMTGIQWCSLFHQHLSLFSACGFVSILRCLTTCSIFKTQYCHQLSRLKADQTTPIICKTCYFRFPR